MKKKIIYFVLLFWLLSDASLTKAQWILDTQLNLSMNERLQMISVTDTSTMWILTNIYPDSGKIYRKSNSIIEQINSSGFFRPFQLTAIDFNRAYLAIYNAIYYTSNSGINWNIILSNPFLAYTGFATSPKATNYIATTYFDNDSSKNKFMLSSNNGSNWQSQYLNLPTDHYSAGISFTDAQHIYIGVNCQAVSCSELNYIFSTNSGANWSTVSFPPISNDVYIMAPQFNTQNIVGFTFAEGYYFYRYRTTDGGASWSPPEYFSLGNTEGMSGIKNVDSSQTWLCAKARNIYKTTNDGANWFEMTIPLNDTDIISSLGVIKNGNKYYAYIGTLDGAIFKFTDNVIPIGIQPISNEIPKTFSLSQNYPNPFNPSTKIKFDVPARRWISNIKLIIYDILGNEVATLVNQQIKAGSYEVVWDASNYSSGIYFYTLQADNFKQTKKLVLLK